MTSRDFSYWLQGFLELTEEQTPLSVKQVDIIRRHLNMVFLHEIDPSMGSQQHQDELTELHKGNVYSPSMLKDVRFNC